MDYLYMQSISVCEIYMESILYVSLKSIWNLFLISEYVE